MQNVNASIETAIDKYSLEDKERIVNSSRIVTILAYTTLVFALFFGTLLYIMDPDLRVLIGGYVEALSCVAVLVLLNAGKHRSAVFITFVIHCASTFYFGMLFTSAIPVEVMGIFLAGIALLLFDDKMNAGAAIGLVAVLIAIILANRSYQFISPIPISINFEKELHSMVTGTVFFLNVLMLGFYVKMNYKWKSRAMEALRELARSKEAIVKHILEKSHQNRNDLNVISGIVQHDLREFGRKLAENDDVTIPLTHLIAINNAAKAIVAQSNNYLEWARIEKGHDLPIQESAINIKEWLGNIADRYKYLANLRPAKLKLNISHSVPDFVHIDHNRLESILSNLLTNAIKFTKTNSLVKLEVTCSNDLLHFSVIDQGKGINNEKLSQIFEPFVTEGTSMVHGSGIGLPVSLAIAKSMGGNLAVDSKLGIGSAFSLSLPLKVASNADEIVDHNDLESLDGLTALVVEDDLMQRKVLEMNLLQAKMKVITCENIDQAKNLFNQEQIDIAIIDKNLQQEDLGITLLRWIKCTKSLVDIPVIIATGDIFSRSGEDVRSNVISAGAGYCITKPLDFSELTRVIGSLLKVSDRNNPILL